MSNNIQTRIRTEVAVIRSMLAQLRKDGFRPVSVFDGDTNTKATTPGAVLTLALNLDECRVFIANEIGTHVGSVLLVFGNDGWDVVSDWSWRETEAGRTFNAVLDKFLERVETIGLPAACKGWHTWAWELNDKSHHGACIKCGCTDGAGVVARQLTEEVHA